MQKPFDFSGKVFGRWTVKKRAGLTNEFWDAICECGTKRIVRVTYLKTGRSISCGCYNNENTAERNKTHGMAYSKENKSWSNMKSRCLNPNVPMFINYGGRGISICKRWINSFANFYSDMGPCPKGHSIERIDVNGNYEPSNCKWIPKADQQKNKRESVILELDGIKKCLIEWGRTFGVSPRFISKRLKKGQSFRDIAKASKTVKIKNRFKQCSLLPFNGVPRKKRADGIVA